MKRILLSAAALFFCMFSLQAQQIPVAPYLPAMTGPEAEKAPITVQYPYENMTVQRGAKNIFLLGKLNLRDATLYINEQKIPVHSNGTFIAYLPVEQGEFEFHLLAQTPHQIYQALRHVIVPGEPIAHFTQRARFDKEEIYPSQPVWLLPGDTVTLLARGTPGAVVTATLSGLKDAKNIKLKEDSRTPGLYRAKYVIRLTEKPRQVKITYSMQDSATDTKTRIQADQRLRILDKDSLQPARVKDPGVKLRQIPVQQGSLYPYYRAYGEVIVDGRDKGLYRLDLGHGEKAWLEESKLDLFSRQDYNTNQLYAMDTLSTQDYTQIRWSGSKQVPLAVHEFSNRMEITFYYTDQFSENFSFDATSPLLERVEWKDPQDGIIKFVLYFKEGQKPWGHAYRYEKNDFVVELMHRPEIHSTPSQPLQGARILIDAGHSPKRTPPYDGTIGPSGFLEYEVNLALAEKLRIKLEQAGAEVIMTREGNNHMSLPARYKMALEKKAHIFVSLHHNALPDSANPLAAPRGYSVYYTYPHSFDLAESIYQSFNRLIALPDNGLIANDVLFIPRIPEIPSVLVENAYMILPEQEELIVSDRGQEKFAEALYQGILNFYGVTPPAKHTKSQSKKRR